MKRPLSYRKHPKSLSIAGIILVLLGIAGLFASNLNLNQTKRTPNQIILSQGYQASLSNASSSSRGLSHTSCRVLTVYDGDTIGCDLNRNGHIEKPSEEIRLLGIDTPEMHYSKKNKTHRLQEAIDEPFAKEASALVTRLALNKAAYLVFDEERYDKYGRTLTYVSLSPEPKEEGALCKLLLEKGYAKTLFIPPNFKHEGDFQTVENKAKLALKGLWGMGEL
ncbi:MAG: thermonuclease family protein [Vampirovibrionales bacterium]|nr:thermonuclease family protein [Vampirovibrionales bacterium]